MSIFNLKSSISSAERRLSGHDPQKQRTSRRQRSDRGGSRLDLAVRAHLDLLMSGYAQPRMRDVCTKISAHCLAHGLKVPSRATVYNYRTIAKTTPVVSSLLPPEVRSCLYNLEGVVTVPAHQLVFHCLNYGNIRAMSFAASMPWLALFQAGRMRGWRPKSRGLLDAIERGRAQT